MSTRNAFWGVSVHRANKPTTFMCRLSWNLGTSNYCNPQGLSKTVQRLLYLYLILGKWKFSATVSKNVLDTLNYLIGKFKIRKPWTAGNCSKTYRVLRSTFKQQGFIEPRNCVGSNA